MIRVLQFILAAFLFTACSEQKSVQGTYAMRTDSNKLDTLHLFNNGKYKRLVYSHYKKLEFYNIGIWKLDKNRIILSNYLQTDQDSINVSGENNSPDMLVTVDFPIGKKAEKTVIYTQIETDNYYYEKTDK